MIHWNLCGLGQLCRLTVSYIGSICGFKAFSRVVCCFVFFSQPKHNANWNDHILQYTTYNIYIHVYILIIFISYKSMTNICMILWARCQGWAGHTWDSVGRRLIPGRTAALAVLQAMRGDPRSWSEIVIGKINMLIHFDYWFLE